MQDIITLDYGSGGLKTAQLIDELIVPAFANTALSQLGDGAVLPALEGPPVFSTDSFVVSPWRFPGGDIGKLAVCGTVNDLCMAGGAPRYLSFSLILEEGFALDDLRAVVASAAQTARQAGVQIVTGDTKVVERGRGDGIYINTAGVGVLCAPGLGRSPDIQKLSLPDTPIREWLRKQTVQCRWSPGRRRPLQISWKMRRWSVPLPHRLRLYPDSPDPERRNRQ